MNETVFLSSCYFASGFDFLARTSLEKCDTKKKLFVLQDTCRRSFSTVMSTGECQTEANLTTVSLPQLSQPLHACSLTVSLLDLINIAILLSVCSEIVMIAVWRIWYLMNLKSPYWYCSLVFITYLLDIILYCWENLCFGHSWKL